MGVIDELIRPFRGLGLFAEQRLHVGVLEIGEVARDVGQVLTDALGHGQVFADEKVRGLGPALSHVDEGAIGGPLVGPGPLAQPLDLFEDEFQASDYVPGALDGAEADWLAQATRALGT